MDLNATLPGKDEEDVNFIEEAAELMMSKMLSVRTRTDEMGRAQSGSQESMLGRRASFESKLKEKLGIILIRFPNQPRALGAKLEKSPV